MKLINKYRNTYTLLTVIVSALLSTVAIQMFMNPSNLLASGVTGVAILIDHITYGSDFYINTALAIVLINIPLALLCYKYVGKRFSLFSCLNFMLTSLFLTIFDFKPLFDDVILNIAFGAFLSAISIVVSLKGNASTGGTDFVALYVSNKYGKSVWDYVLYFNVFVIICFGFTTSWKAAGYSILFQFISTKTIDTLHTRYKRMTLQIITQKAEEIRNAYINNFSHGITIIETKGGYHNKNNYLLLTILSSYEVRDAIDLIKSIDDKVIINVFDSKDFIGNYYHRPMD